MTLRRRGTDPRHPFLVSHGLIDYPFPCNDGKVMASLVLPERITAEDADRLALFVQTLAEDGERKP